jgi:hypothetical protein
MINTMLRARKKCLLLFTVTVGLLACSQVGFGQSEAKKDSPEEALAKAKPPIRMLAGANKKFKDSSGNEWLPDMAFKDYGFQGGETIARPDIKIANTKDQEIYRAEHYSMDSFNWKLPNGKYVVKLHFCETYDGIGGPGDRVFDFKVQDKAFKDFDVWKKSGGFQKAYVEVVPVEVTDGKLKITFTPKVENPQVNGIEILPPEKDAKDAKSEKSASDTSASDRQSGSDSKAVTK